MRQAKIIGLYAFYFILCFAFYHRAASASLCYDLLDFLILYKKKGWAGFAINFHDAIVRQFFHINHLVILKLFDLNYKGWNFVSVSLHSLNALLICLFTRFLARLTYSKNLTIMPVFAGFIFLLSPYQTETVVWGCTIHYLTTIACILTALISCLKFFETNTKYYLALINVCFFIGMFSLEFTFMLPFMLMCLYYFFYPMTDEQKRRRLWLWAIIPQLLFFPFYFLLDKLILGKFIGHYGAEVHLNFMASTIFFNTARHILNYTIFLEFLPGSINQKIILFLRFNQNHILPYLAAGTLLLLWVSRRKPVLLLSIGLFFISLAPVANMYLWLFFLKESDRLGYLALVFFSIILSYGAFAIFNRVAASILLSAYVLLGCWFLEQNLSDWQHAGDIANTLTTDFVKRFSHDKVIVIAEAGNYNGAYLFAPNFTWEHWNYDLDKRVELATGKPPVYPITHTLHFEMKEETDSVNVQRLGVDSFMVTASRPALRLLYNYYPLRNHEDSIYKLVEFDNGNRCLVIFKSPVAGKKLIYQQGLKWDVID